jgi:hypothetical protein
VTRMVTLTAIRNVTRRAVACRALAEATRLLYTALHLLLECLTPASHRWAATVPPRSAIGLDTGMSALHRLASPV